MLPLALMPRFLYSSLCGEMEINISHSCLLKLMCLIRVASLMSKWPEEARRK